MKKNIDTQEAHIRTIAGAVILLFALFFVDNASFRILLAIIAAVLAGTAYMRSSPIKTLMEKRTQKADPLETTLETDTPPAPMPEKPVVGMEEESTAPTEEITEGKTV